MNPQYRASWPLATAVLFLLAACSAGFTPLNGGPIKGNRSGPVQTFEMDCRDTPKADGATSIAGQSDARGASGAYYYASCTYEGKPLPWKVLGVLHSSTEDTYKWEKYREGTIKKAEKLGCPAIALRRFPTTVGDGFEGIGALCVDP